MGFITIGLTVYLRIREGRGAEPFQNVYGQVETWASYAGGVIGGLVMLLVGSLIAGWQRWRRRVWKGES